MKKVISLLIMTAMLAGILSGCVSATAGAESYVALDLNEAAVQFVVNADDQVVAFSAATEEGETLLDGEDYVGQDIDDVIADVIDNAIDQGYIDTEATEEDPNAILVTTEHLRAKFSAQWKERVMNYVDSNLVVNGVWAIILSAEDIEEIADVASQYGMSVARVRMAMALMKGDPELTFEEVKDMKPNELMNMVKEQKPLGTAITNISEKIAQLEAELLTLDEVEDAERIGEINEQLTGLNNALTALNNAKDNMMTQKQLRKAAHQDAVNQWKSEKSSRAANIQNRRNNQNRNNQAEVAESKRQEIGERFRG